MRAHSSETAFYLACPQPFYAYLIGEIARRWSRIGRTPAWHSSNQLMHYCTSVFGESIKPSWRKTLKFLGMRQFLEMVLWHRIHMLLRSIVKVSKCRDKQTNYAYHMSCVRRNSVKPNDLHTTLMSVGINGLALNCGQCDCTYTIYHCAFNKYLLDSPKHAATTQCKCSKTISSHKAAASII